MEKRITVSDVIEGLRIGVRPATGGGTPVFDGAIETYLYISVQNGKGNVTPELLAACGMTPDTAREIAFRNTRDAVDVKTMADIMREFGADIPDVPGMPVMIVATNRERMYGASALLFPCILADILKANGIQKARIAPSSVHEVIITEMLEGDDIDGMVSEINDSTVAPEDRLADHWYFIDQSGKITWNSKR